MKLTIPNIISLVRAAIAPVFFVFIISHDPSLVQLACLLFFIGAMTDYIDGWLARKYHMITSWGVFIDPLADKFLTSAAFIGFYTLDMVDLWMIIIILIRDFGTTVLRLYADSLGKPVVTSRSAKFKTFLQMMFISYILVLLFIKNSTFFAGQKETAIGLLNSSSIYYSMLVLTVLTVWTAVEYGFQNKNLFKMLNFTKFLKKTFANEKTFQ